MRHKGFCSVGFSGQVDPRFVLYIPAGVDQETGWSDVIVPGEPAKGGVVRSSEIYSGYLNLSHILSLNTEMAMYQPLVVEGTEVCSRDNQCFQALYIVFVTNDVVEHTAIQNTVAALGESVEVGSVFHQHLCHLCFVRS